jgi:2-phosphinomethylmalic acid synthase
MSKSDDAFEPHLLRHIFPTHRVPRSSFSEDSIPISVPQVVSCIDSTLAHGALALRHPSIEEATAFYDRLERLNHKSGLIRRLELMVDVTRGRELLAELIEHQQEEGCQVEPVALLPRPSPDAVKILTDLDVGEAGLMCGVSDYLRRERGAAGSLQGLTEHLICTIDACVERRIRPRLDLVDVTRADVEGFVLPAVEICQNHLGRRGGGQLRVRLCDTFGLGLPWTEAPVPRSVPRLLRLIGYALGLKPEQLEFVGYNEMGLALANTISAALHGCGGLVASVGGVGERSGLAPLEQALIHLSGLFGMDCDLTVVSEMLSMLARQGLKLGLHNPLWGEAGLTTCLVPSWRPVKETLELYAPFDTRRLIGRAPEVSVRVASGALGLAHLIHRHLPEADLEADEGKVWRLLEWVAERSVYTDLDWETIKPKVRELLPQHFGGGGEDES